VAIRIRALYEEVLAERRALPIRPIRKGFSP
jgi:hypothetical protein